MAMLQEMAIPYLVDVSYWRIFLLYLRYGTDAIGIIATGTSIYVKIIFILDDDFIDTCIEVLV